MDNIDSVKDFAGGAAHDINNFLTGILGFSAMLREDSDRDSRAYFYAKEIENSGMKLKALVDKMLLLKRMSTCKKIEASAGDVIKSAVRQARSNVPEISEVVLDLEDMPGVYADPEKLSLAIEFVMGYLAYRSDGVLAIKGEFPVERDGQKGLKISIMASGMPKDRKQKVSGRAFSYTTFSHVLLGYEAPLALEIIGDHGGYMSLSGDIPGPLVSEIWLPVG